MQEKGGGTEKLIFEEAPRPGFGDSIINFLLSHWKLLIFLAGISIACLYYWSVKSSQDSSSEQSEKTSKASRQTNEDVALIEGIYYGEYVNGHNDEPFPATVTRSSNGINHYLLSVQGQVYDFYMDSENGTLSSSALGSGEIDIDSITSEIVIKFKGWIFKH